ncbi:MAG: stage IV sporulation protein A [Clostridia bacterium]|nr:stage IV sporulation protein A [Clostridia bacterium]
MDVEYGIYKDIAERSNGAVYIGVVGPVRCGKSTFISKCMREFVLPNITDKYDLARTEDELPLSADGTMIMTTKPQFVPSEPVNVNIDNVAFKLRMIDCVGYLVEGASGYEENDQPRMVETPWSKEKMPFTQAATLGTKKVIAEHSNIVVLMTSDGSFGDITRDSYAKAEGKLVKELKHSKKPFVIVLNSAKPKNEETLKLKQKLNITYKVPVVCCDVSNLSKGDIDNIMSNVLTQFPLEVVSVKIPNYLRALPNNHPIIAEIVDTVFNSVQEMQTVGEGNVALFEQSENFEPILANNIQMGQGEIVYEVVAKENLFYKVLSIQCGCEINNDFELISCLKELTVAKTAYDKLKRALDEVDENGYGIVVPNIDEMELMEPEIVRHGSRCGVKLKANAPSLHIMKVDVQTEVSPIMGGVKQSEEMAEYLLKEFENNPKGIWQTNMFGKSLESLVREDLNNKLTAMPQVLQNKMRKTLSRIVNEGKGGIICILL